MNPDYNSEHLYYSQQAPKPLNGCEPVLLRLIGELIPRPAHVDLNNCYTVVMRIWLLLLAPSRIRVI